MSTDAVEGIVLDVQLTQDEWCLHLDTNELWQEQEEADPIVTVRLRGCGDVTEALERLRLYVGNHIFLEAVEEAGKVVGMFLELDYGTDEMQIACGSITQEHREYTQEELRRHCQRLRAAYHKSENALRAMERKHGTFVAEVTKMADSGLDRCQRKLDFFRSINPERAAETQGRIWVYERVLTKLAQLRKQDLGAA